MTTILRFIFCVKDFKVFVDFFKKRVCLIIHLNLKTWTFLIWNLLCFIVNCTRGHFVVSGDWSGFLDVISMTMTCRLELLPRILFQGHYFVVSGICTSSQGVGLFRRGLMLSYLPPCRQLLLCWLRCDDLIASRYLNCDKKHRKRPPQITHAAEQTITYQ